MMNPRKHSILIVDDSPADREAYRRMLAAAHGPDYAIVECSTAESALAELNQRSYDCVLLDYRLPDGDGLEVLTGLRSVCGANETAVVIITGQGDEAIAVQAMKRGAQDYLIKGSLAPDGLHIAVLRAIDRLHLRRQIEEQQAEIARLATTDELTGIPNRRSCDDELKREFSRARRYQLNLSILLLDVDHFKSINDTHGHPIGDQVLVAMAQSIQRASRATDFVGRYGGDEFFVLVPETNLAGAESLAWRICKSVSNTSFLDRSRRRFQLSCSIGAASLEPAMVEPADMLDAADQALYSAKRAGRARVATASPQVR